MAYTWDTAMEEGRRRPGGDVAGWDRELAELDEPARLFVGPMTVPVIANTRT